MRDIESTVLLVSRGRPALKLSNSYLAQRYNISSSAISHRCGLKHGNYLTWLVRELLSRHDDDLSEEERTYLYDMFGMLLRSRVRMGGMLNDLFINKLLVFRLARLNILADGYRKYSPFDVSLGYEPINVKKKKVK